MLKTYGLSDNRWIRLGAAVLLLVLVSILVMHRHRHTGEFNWRSKMWGDQAGYYIYTPALIIYDFNAAALPEGIVDKTGSGFTISESGKIITRYSYGVSLMQLPFFLAVYLYNGLTGQPQDGFSGNYHKVSGIAAIFYTFLGLILLWKFLISRFRKRIAFLTIATLYAGTNLLYYSIDATGMSHIYSFSLFALLLVLSESYFRGGSRGIQFIRFAAISLTCALIILIRPTNLAFTGLVFILDIRSWRALIERFRQVFTPVNILVIIVSFTLIFFPQFLYWKYSSGSFFTNPYQGYGFTNLWSPRIVEFLFSTNNGMFTYNPVYFLIFGALVVMAYRRRAEAFYILGVVAVLIYLFSSWFVFSFGCGFGSRNFVEYTVVFAIPVAWMFDVMCEKKMVWKLLMVPFLLVFLWTNLQLTRVYNKCFLKGDWDWTEYSYMMKLRPYSAVHTYFPAERLGSMQEFSKKHNIGIRKYSGVNYRRAVVSADAEVFSDSTGAMIVFAIVAGDSTIYWNGHPFRNSYDFGRGGRQKIKGDFWLPENYDVNSVASAFIWNIQKDSIKLSRLRIELE